MKKNSYIVVTVEENGKYYTEHQHLQHLILNNNLHRVKIYYLFVIPNSTENTLSYNLYLHQQKKQYVYY